MATSTKFRAGDTDYPTKLNEMDDDLNLGTGALTVLKDAAAGSAASSAADAITTGNNVTLSAAEVVNAQDEVTLATAQVALAANEVALATAQVALATTEVTNAQAQVTLAAGQVTLAAAQVTLAETIYDNFDGRWLGDKATDPTLDNNGNALLTGAAYFHTGINKTKLYNGTSWAAIQDGMGSLVEDTTPQLGGDLDLNSNVITGMVIGTDVQAYDATILVASDIGSEVLAPTGDGSGLTGIGTTQAQLIISGAM